MPTVNIDVETIVIDGELIIHNSARIARCLYKTGLLFSGRPPKFPV
jgi:hypothetical protein